jgi:hypothetical protein
MCGIDLAGCELGSQASCCNYGTEPLGFTKFRQSSSPDA